MKPMHHSSGGVEGNFSRANMLCLGCSDCCLLRTSKTIVVRPFQDSHSDSFSSSGLLTRQGLVYTRAETSRFKLFIVLHDSHTIGNQCNDQV
jgi:hypothetical protein